MEGEHNYVRLVVREVMYTNATDVVALLPVQGLVTARRATSISTKNEKS